jgi:hypothetical protein
MLFGIVTLLTALSMATVAAVFAIYGIMAIFAGMPLFALVMGAVIELGKVVGVSWLYRNWGEPTKIKYAMTPLVLIAMLLTSLGIFGLLSKAHLEQTSPVLNNQLQIERIEQQISRELSKITDSDNIITQLDQSVQVLINFDRVRGPDGALAVREAQAPQRDILRQVISDAQDEIDHLEDRKLELSQELRSVELEVGPIKYIAELIYGEETTEIDQAVRFVIIAFIFVFDPMAVLLLMAANFTFDQRRLNKTLNSTAVTPLVEARTESDIKTTNPELHSPKVTEPERVIETLSVFENIPEPKHSETSTDSVPSSVDDAANVIAESYAKKKTKEIETSGVTPATDLGNGYVEYDNHLYHRAALKEIKPELFLQVDDPNMPEVSFGTKFPGIAKNKNIFVRVDVIPNRVFKFNNGKWIEINKDLSTTYLYNEEYIKYLVEKINQGEYDVDLLSEKEKIQLEEYLENFAK